MSAYALPGLFPPIDTMSQSCSKDISTVDDSSSMVDESPSNRKMPLHLQDYEELYSNKDFEVNSSSSSNIGDILNSAAIAVKEAKIDPVRWIQYVTGSNPQQYAQQIGKTLRRRVSTSNNSSTVGTRSSGQPNRTSSGFNSTGGYDNMASSCSSNNKSQQNEAIEFELSITFNGRKYTAKRTMQCIMQLRDDLIREMRRRRQWLTQKEGLSAPSPLKTSHESSKMDKFDDHFRLSQPSYFDVDHSSSEKVATMPEHDINHSGVVQIPEIPPFTSGHDRRHMLGDTGFVGKGFTMLHAMVKSYVPAMEGWLKKVMEIVPQDSECLMNFLWEPTTEIPSACFKSVLDSVNNSDQSMCVSNKFKSSTSLATLGSIKEMDYDSEDDDSEDDPDEYSSGGWKV
jgi:hypothetical protein